MSIEQWIDIYENRLEWAYKAHDNWLVNIESEDVKKISSKGEKNVTIALFGKSQVGKTTLILKLLGIKDDLFSKVYSAVRGSINKTGSATPTAFVYQKSIDNNFYISTKEEVEISSLEKLKKEIISIREEIENNKQSFHLEQVIIKIPKSYFDTEKVNRINIDIIDLPGFESSNKDEQPHVKNIIGKYIPRCNLILLVVPIDKIQMFEKFIGSSYFPNGLDWSYNMEGFRFLVSRTFCNYMPDSKKTMPEIAMDCENIADFKSKMKPVFTGTDFYKSGMWKKIYFFDYGDSWENHLEDLKEKVKPWLDDFENNLIKDINKTATPENQLQLQSKKWEIVEKYIDDKKEEHKGVVKEKEDEIVESKENIKIFKESTDDLKLDIKEYIKRKTKLNNYKPFFKFIVDTPADWRNTPNELGDYLQKNIKLLKEVFNKFNKILEEYELVTITYDVFNDIYNNRKYNHIRRTLDDRWDNWAYQQNWLWNGFLSSDRYDSECALASIRNNLRNDLIKRANIKKSNKLEEINNQIKDVKGQIEANDLQINELGHKKSEKEKIIEKLEKKHNKKIPVLEKDKKKAKEFFKYLEKGFENKKDELYSSINDSEGESENKLLKLLEIELMVRRMKKIQGV